MRDDLAPGLYRGWVRHRRYTPVEHEFRYRLFMAWLDIDRLEELMGVSPWCGYERRAMLSYRGEDHFGDARRPLRERLEEAAEEAGLRLPAGPVYVLTNLRYAGYCFNPISLYYCYGADRSKPERVMAEVHSTFGEQHNYWIEGLEADGIAKRLHVSPFNTMDNEYSFRFHAPGERLVAHIDTLRAGQRFFDATLSMEWSAWERGNVESAIVEYPLLTAKVIGAIHWEALKLFFKRVPFVPHPLRR